MLHAQRANLWCRHNPQELQQTEARARERIGLTAYIDCSTGSNATSCVNRPDISWAAASDVISRSSVLRSHIPHRNTGVLHDDVTGAPLRRHEAKATGRA